MDVTTNVASHAEKSDLPMAMGGDSLLPGRDELIPGPLQPITAAPTSQPATSNSNPEDVSQLTLVPPNPVPFYMAPQLYGGEAGLSGLATAPLEPSLEVEPPKLISPQVETNTNKLPIIFLRREDYIKKMSIRGKCEFTKDSSSEYEPATGDGTSSDETSSDESSSNESKAIKKYKNMKKTKRVQSRKLKITSKTKSKTDKSDDGSNSENHEYNSSMQKKKTTQNILNNTEDQCGGSDTKHPDEYNSEDTEDEGNEDKLYANDMKHVFVMAVKMDNLSKKGCIKKHKSPRVYNKKNLCPYCLRLRVNFERHLEDCHREEDEVKKALGLKPKSNERGRLIDRLRARGNHFQNMHTIRCSRGMFIPQRRPSTNKAWNVRDYGPCSLCKVWMKLDLLYRHRRVCPEKANLYSNCKMSCNEILLESDLVAGRIDNKASLDLINEAYKIMKNDEVSKVAKNDPLIVQAGNGVMMRNIGNKAMRRYYASSVMRLLARLLIELRKLQVNDNFKQSLSFYKSIHPSQYHNYVTAVFEVCGNIEVDDDDEDDLHAPSNAVKLSYDITRLCYAKISQAIDHPDKERGEEDRKNTKRFLDKFSKNWGTDVKKKAKHVLRQRRMNVLPELPVAQDIVRLAEHLKEELSNAQWPTTIEKFHDMQLDVLARLISYNRRRPGEVQALR